MFQLVHDCKEFLKKSAPLVKVTTEAVNFSLFPAHFPSPRALWSQHPDYPQHFDADWIFVSDLLNFSFWADLEEEQKEQMEQLEKTGFSAFVRALNAGRAVLCDPEKYSKISFEEFCALMPRGMPMLPERHQILTEAGAVLIDYFRGSFAHFISCTADDEFIPKLCQFFPSFRDCPARWFLKRAQILVADLWVSGGCFDDGSALIESLTIFADYRIPQMLWYLGAIELSPELERSLRQHNLLAVESEPVLELRAASIVAADEICTRLNVGAVQLDYFLWDWSQGIKQELEADFPFHRTRSIYY